MKFTYLFLLFLIAANIDQSVAETDSVELRDWRTAKVSRTLESVPADESTAAIAKRLEKAFSEKPIYDGFTELLLDRVFKIPATGDFVFAFNVRHVDDIWAVFVVDGAGRIADNFVLSRWNMYED